MQRRRVEITTERRSSNVDVGGYIVLFADAAPLLYDDDNVK